MLITYSNYALTYLRQGLLDLRDLDFIVFEPKATYFGQENPFELIMQEFYIPQYKVGSKEMPPIYLINTKLLDVGFLIMLKMFIGRAHYVNT